MAPTLEQVLSIRIFRSKDDVLTFGSTKGNAQRFIQPLIGGYLRGDGINADFVQGGSDWVSFDAATGTGHLDARLQFQDKQTGAAFYVSFTGIVKFDEKIQLVMQWSPEAKTTQSKDHYSFTNPVFEVSNEEHKWMEQTVFVGHGHYYVPGDGTQAVEYEVYKLVTG